MVPLKEKHKKDIERQKIYIIRITYEDITTRRKRHIKDNS